MTEEEKQAIERIKEDLKEAEKLNYMYADINIYDLYDVLNLIEKQQKDYISKDKIRDKIKELKEIGKYQIDHKDLYLEQESIDILKELLEGE